MRRLPGGWERAAVRGAEILARRESLDFVKSAVMEAGSLYARAGARAELGPGPGRGGVRVLAGPNGAWIVRHYLRGGWMSWLGDRYLRAGEPRPEREVRASEAARMRGVDTPEVLAIVRHDAGPFYRADIATRRVENAETLGALTFGRVPWNEAERVEAWRAAGALIHGALCKGVIHADLNIDNVLIARTPDGVRAWLLDLDRCRVTDHAGAAARKRVVRRFQRSIRKRERLAGRALGNAEREALVREIAHSP